MGLVADLQMYARFAWGLHGFFQQTVSPEQARANIQCRLAEREASFVRLVERGVFGWDRSPYRPLFRLAQCEMGDVQALVRSQGVEATLRAWREAGIYITFEEFKGRRPVERHGTVLPVQASDFDNPYHVRQYETYTGGSTGAATRNVHDLQHLAIQREHLLVTRQAHGLLEVPTALWRGILPDGSGINNVLRAARFGRVPEKWFSQLVPRLPRDLKYYTMSLALAVIGRLHGVPVPRPEWVPLDRAIVVAEWAGNMVRRHGRCLVITQVSRALLACLLGQASTWQAIWLSNQALIVGFLLAVGVGIPLGLALGASRGAARFADIYLNTLLVIPISALLPLFILATGLTLTSRAIVVFVFSFVIITVNTEVGLRQVDPGLVEMARSFGADRTQLWRTVLLPGALPVILGGLRLGLGRAIAGMVVVELLLVAVGFGRLILRFQGDFEAAFVYAVVLIVIAGALLLLWLLQALQRRWVRWGAEVVVE